MKRESKSCCHVVVACVDSFQESPSLNNLAWFEISIVSLKFTFFLLAKIFWHSVWTDPFE